MNICATQAMALQHANDIEIACNLLDTTQNSPEAVLERCKELVAAEGGSVASSYRIGRDASELLAILSTHLSGYT
jgi:hypothetical protein